MGTTARRALLFQKNVTRWKTWKPQTPETERRLKEANADIAECDRPRYSRRGAAA